MSVQEEHEALVTSFLVNVVDHQPAFPSLTLDEGYLVPFLDCLATL